MITEKNMMHGIDYSAQNIDGWIASEKLNGCRVFWAQGELWTRNGNIVLIPDAWRRKLRKFKNRQFDGELHAGRAGYTEARLAVQYGRFTDACELSVFDAPDLHAPFLDCYRELKSILPLNGPINYVEQVRVYSLEDAVRMMLYIQTRGGEGVMVRDPQGRYIAGRTEQMLKLKSVPAIYWQKAAA